MQFDDVVKSLVEQCQNKMKFLGTKVMFAAVADHGGDFGPYKVHRTLVFNKEITNSGDAYNSTSGIFKAPVAGCYFFSFFYQADKSRASGLFLMKNREVMVKTFDDNRAGPVFTDNAGNTAFLKLQKGDQVSVRLPAGCHVTASDRVTTFSGFLLREI